MTPVFTEEQYDALCEICNIAMGQASRALATLLDLFVDLSVPEIAILASAEVDAYLGGLGDKQQDVAAVRQSFYGGISGEVIALHTRGSSTDIVELLGYEGTMEQAEQREFLLDVSNLLSGAVLTGIGEQLGMELAFSAPSLINERVQLQDLRVDRDASWTRALFTQVQFNLEQRAFSSRLLVFLPDSSFAAIQTAVDRFLDEL